MVRCPNCGRKTSGDSCQWCKYPIPKGSQTRHRIAKQAENQAKIEAKLATKEQARKEAEEARIAKQTEKQAKIEAKLAAKEQARKAKQAGKCLKQIERTCEELEAGKIGTKEAIQRLSDITERIDM